MQAARTPRRKAMKKTSTKKLMLKTETLRNLQRRQLEGAAGGIGSTACTNPTLWTDCCKPNTNHCTPACEW
jgi:hypothetical protein